MHIATMTERCTITKQRKVANSVIQHPGHNLPVDHKANANIYARRTQTTNMYTGAPDTGTTAQTRSNADRVKKAAVEFVATGIAEKAKVAPRKRRDQIHRQVATLTTQFRHRRGLIQQDLHHDARLRPQQHNQRLVREKQKMTVKAL